MGGLAVVAIILAIVVAIKTFSDPNGTPVNPPTQPISGLWTRVINNEPTESHAGAPVEYMVVKDLATFDATNATGTSGTVLLTYADGLALTCKVMMSQPGHLMLQVPTKTGKSTQITIAQMGDGGPTMVSDGITNLQFELSK